MPHLFKGKAGLELVTKSKKSFVIDFFVFFELHVNDNFTFDILQSFRFNSIWKFIYNKSSPSD